MVQCKPLSPVLCRRQRLALMQSARRKDWTKVLAPPRCSAQGLQGCDRGSSRGITRARGSGTLSADTVAALTMRNIRPHKLNLQSPEVSGDRLRVSLRISSKCYIRPGIWEYRDCVVYLPRRRLRSFMIKNRHGEKRQTAKFEPPWRTRLRALNPRRNVEL